MVVTFDWCRESLTMLAADRADVIEATARTVWSRSQSRDDTVADSVGKHVFLLLSYMYILFD